MMLEVREISVGYTNSPVLTDVSLELKQEEVVTLIGANGAGKSTLVKAISGLMRPISGEIWFEGQRIHSLPTGERLRRGIAHVPEGRQVFGGMTVEENLDLGRYISNTPERDRARLEQICNQFPLLRERRNDTAGNFSGGQQQILAIARGLMSNPRLLLLDEPSLGVSPILVAELFKLVQELRAHGISILLAEQNARAALAIADRGYVIENGRVALSGPASELLKSKEIAERYLGVGTATAVSTAESARMAARLRECIT
jgi:branched-chain amino acid transport system ATP-binding protein